MKNKGLWLCMFQIWRPVWDSIHTPLGLGRKSRDWRSRPLGYLGLPTISLFYYVFMVENDRKHLKMSKKYLFHHAHERLMMKKNEEKVCWSAIGSDSKSLVGTQTLVAHLEFCCFLFFFLHAPLMCTMIHFQMFLIVFDHANVCASMCSLVEIHNSTLIFAFSALWFQCSDPARSIFMVLILPGTRIPL